MKPRVGDNDIMSNKATIVLDSQDILQRPVIGTMSTQLANGIAGSALASMKGGGKAPDERRVSEEVFRR